MTDEDLSESVKLSSVKGTRSVMKFALPSILMMVLTSSYVMVDGLMISNLINTDALAGANLTMPLFSILTAIGFMFATGGSAWVSRKMGQGLMKEANSDFTLIILFALFLGILFTVIGFIFIDPLVELIGADDVLRPYTKNYLEVNMIFFTCFIIQFIASQFLVVAGKPMMSLFLAIVAGVVNIVFDYILILFFDMGVAGAALASGLSALIPCLVSMIIFMRKKSEIRFSKPSMDMHVIISSAYNGMSEMVSEISASISSLAFNLVMMHYIGPDGVSAITVIMYVQFLALAVIIGYSMGVAPVMGYNYGKGDRENMSSLYRTSMFFVISFSLSIFIIMESFGQYFVRLFDTGNIDLRDIAVYGISIHSFAYLVMGINLYASSLFTSLSDGLRSAIISSLRGLIILVPMIVLLPMVFGVEGIWLAIPVTDFITVVVTVYLLRTQSDRYGYSNLVRFNPSK